MTAKDYRMLASVIADTAKNSSFADDFNYQHALHKLAMNLGSKLSETNPRFDYDRFMLACRAN